MDHAIKWAFEIPQQRGGYQLVNDKSIQIRAPKETFKNSNNIPLEVFLNTTRCNKRILGQV
jgi:hypothetical protein